MLGSGHILPCKLFIAHQTFGLWPTPLESPHAGDTEDVKFKSGDALAVRPPEASPGDSPESPLVDPAVAGGVGGVAAAGDP